MLFSILKSEGANRLLTKSFFLGNDGEIEKVAAQVALGRGTLRRAAVSDFAELNAVLSGLSQNECIITGTYIGDERLERDGVVQIAAEAQLGKGEVARNKENIDYAPGQPGLCFLDFDFKGVPDDLRERFEREHGNSIVSLIRSLGLAEFDRAGWLIRGSSSAGVQTCDGSKRLDSNNQHGYFVLRDGAHMPVVAAQLHFRLLKAGWGFGKVSRSGAILVQTLLDIGSSNPERIIFEADPVLADGLVRPETKFEVVEGGPVDAATIIGLTQAELSEEGKIIAQLRAPLREEAARRRAEWLRERTAEMIAGGKSENEAKALLAQLERGELFGDHVVKLDGDREVPVFEIIRNWQDYAGARAYCPVEPEKGRTRALIYGEELDDAGLPRLARIRSFMGGGTIFKLKLDTGSLLAAMQGYNSRSAAITGISALLLYYEHDPEGVKDDLVGRLAEVSSFSRKDAAAIVDDAVNDAVKTLRAMKERAQVAALRGRAADSGRDAIADPDPDEPRTTFHADMRQLIIDRRSASPVLMGPTGEPTTVRKVPVKSRFSGEVEHHFEFHPHNEKSHAVELERHFLFWRRTKNGIKEVPINATSNAYLYADASSVYPSCPGLVQHPILRHDGSVYTPQGYDWDTGLFGCSTAQIDISGPPPTVTEVFKATNFLLNSVCCDVLFKSDHDRMGFLAMLCTALVVKQLKLCPGFLVNANSVSVGKTTLVRMVSYAALGHDLPMLAWPDGYNGEEEGEKRMLSLMLKSPLMIGIDNLKRGSVFASSALEGIITAEQVASRILGQSRVVDVDAAVIPVLTGNEVSLSEDTASRFVTINLDAKTANPELRELRRPKALEWVKANREKILMAAYTIMRFRFSDQYIEHRSQSRFPGWDEVVGSPVMNAMRIWHDVMIRRPADTGHAHYPDSDGMLSFGQAFMQSREEGLETRAMSDVVHGFYAGFGEELFPLSKVSELRDLEEHNMSNQEYAPTRMAAIPEGHDLSGLRSWRGIEDVMYERYRDMAGIDDKKPVAMRAMSKRFASHTEPVAFHTVERNDVGEWVPVRIEARLITMNVNMSKYRKMFKVEVISRRFEHDDSSE